ncbi:MAG: HAMP domain-containing histidine kinase [Magnetospirillum sp.]|nr:HAMP domain-containing histidine kinase [Magnetospirillum sp.]
METRPAKWLALGLFLALAAGTAGLAFGRIDRFVQASEDLNLQPFELADALLRAHHHVHSLQIQLNDLILSADTAAAGQVALRESPDDTGLVNALNLVVSNHSGDPDVLAKLVRGLSDWRDTRARVADLLAEGRWHDAAALHNSAGERSYRSLHAALDQALDAERSHAAQLRAEVTTAHRSTQRLIIALAVLTGGAVAATGLGLVVLISTHRPLRRLRSSLLALAAGDTDVSIPYTRNPNAVGALARAIHCFRQSALERDAVTRALRLSEERLRRAVDEALLAEQAKNRFLAAASHDLRQPLQALRLYLDTLDRRLHDRLDRRILTGALTALSAGEDLLGNYLDVSVLESGIITPDMDDVAIGPLLADVLREWYAPAADKGLNLRLVPSRAMVRSDPALLRRLLRSLVANAVRFTLKGSVLVGCRRRGDTLRIEVWDTGIGIPHDQLHAVFEDFYQIGNPERDRAKGLGLGLSVVDRAARLLGHEIGVASRPGAGSVFTVSVPLAGHTPPPADALAA